MVSVMRKLAAIFVNNSSNEEIIKIEMCEETNATDTIGSSTSSNNNTQLCCVTEEPKNGDGNGDSKVDISIKCEPIDESVTEEPKSGDGNTDFKVDTFIKRVAINELSPSLNTSTDSVAEKWVLYRPRTRYAKKRIAITDIIEIMSDDDDDEQRKKLKSN
ncbi:hypothetical protein Bhyg_06185 [Pseudolycoriella hygida]|uniref:Uncharacterized protein n=1 Tax=Pseudolycoriella hygida TaxID=35572 RepID=A0A9Q0S2P6_9DIPT|nr:hypothetical protein Bhyg_06185 [Pseudolycoriella hygida]